MDRAVKTARLTREIAYQPLPSQERFHDSDKRFKGFSGPVGSGKSQALCHEAIRLSYLNPGRTGLIGAPTYPMLRDATLRAFIEILESNHLPYELNKAENYIVMKDTRSKILFRSLDEYERLRGTNLSWFGVDELTYTAEEAWLRLEARLRDPKAKYLCGFAVWTPKGKDWVYRKFLSEPVTGYDAVIARPFENLHILDKIPDFYERLKRSYDEGFYRQEVLGQYLTLTRGLVYKSFLRGIHVQPTHFDSRRMLLWSLDFNVDPMSSVLAQIGPHGVVHVVDEIVLSDSTTEKACEELEARYGRLGGGLRIFGDASGERRQSTGWSDYDIVRRFFKRAGIEVSLELQRSNPPVRDRVALVNAKLSNAAEEVGVLIDSRCRELIRDLEEVVYKPGSIQIDKEVDPRRTHLSDALGYLLWKLDRGLQTVGPRNRQLLCF